MWNMFKVTNKDTRRRSGVFIVNFEHWRLYCYLWTYFTPWSNVSIVNFEKVNADWKGLTSSNCDFESWIKYCTIQSLRYLSLKCSCFCKTAPKTFCQKIYCKTGFVMTKLVRTITFKKSFQSSEFDRNQIPVFLHHTSFVSCDLATNQLTNSTNFLVLHSLKTSENLRF